MSAVRRLSLCLQPTVQQVALQPLADEEKDINHVIMQPMLSPIRQQFVSPTYSLTSCFEALGR